jgi:transient receptor potential cation channel subfamily C member 4
VAEQQKRDDFGITEDDVMEVRQDISTLRYEIVDILRNNGMSTPNLDPNDSSSKSHQVTKFSCNI